MPKVEESQGLNTLKPFLRKRKLNKIRIKTRKNAIVEYLDYQIPVTQLMGPKGNGDMHFV